MWADGKTIGVTFLYVALFISKGENVEEVWKDVIGFEGIYQVSNDGRVKSLERQLKNGSKMQHRRERMLSPHKTKQGYMNVTLCKDGKTFGPYGIHRIVAEAFIPNPENKPVERFE